MLEGLEFAAAVLVLGLRAFRELFSPARRGRGEVFRVITRQILFTGVDALPVVGAIALMLGLIIIIPAGTTLPQVGAGAFLSRIMELTLLRELGPRLTALTVLSRWG